MMKKVLLGGLFGGVCFAAGAVAELYLQWRMAKDAGKKLLTGETNIEDLDKFDLGMMIMFLKDDVYDEAMDRYREKVDNGDAD